MARRCCFWLCILGILVLTSCQRAQQYRVEAKKPAVEVEETKDDEKRALRSLSWIEPTGETSDVPIVFVAESSAEWARLKAYWNAPPTWPAGMPTVHFGLADPLPAVTALVATEPHFAVKIKVPRGLPDPTPNFPRSNPPTLAKWTLGKKLFHERRLQIGADSRSCASCHVPEHSFADDPRRPEGGTTYNTLSLVNVAYNRRQFWDGRVRTLEETLVRSFADEGPFTAEQSKERALEEHNFGGFVRDLKDSKKFNEEFKLVFAVEHPTQDTVAQALATYLRTILSGDSLYDRAEQVRRDKKDKVLSGEHFADLLKDYPDLEKKHGRDQASTMLAKGYALFHGKAACVQCHSGALFTDYDYHNIGIEAPAFGSESGRAVQVPVGLKEARLIGAYRTPSLRNLLKKAWYFHDRSQSALAQVVDYFDIGVQEAPGRLGKELLDGEKPRKLNLSEYEKDSLLMFLRALEGTPVDPIVSGLAK